MSIRTMTRVAMVATAICIAAAFVVARYTDWPLTYSTLLHNFSIVGVVISALLFVATWYNRAKHAED
jgi:hypothetical protein